MTLTIRTRIWLTIALGLLLLFGLSGAAVYGTTATMSNIDANALAVARLGAIADSIERGLEPDAAARLLAERYAIRRALSGRGAELRAVARRTRAVIGLTALVGTVVLLLIGRGFVREAHERDRLRSELRTTIGELEKAMASIKTLTGLLPMCSACHRIRDDQGTWERIEHYVTTHTEAEVSHGMCPECFPKYFPDLPYDEKDRLTV